jgi:hypothetical protein
MVKTVSGTTKILQLHSYQLRTLVRELNNINNQGVATDGDIKKSAKETVLP